MKTPILALLLAGATAQKKPQMMQDHAAPMNPIKPGDLEGCSDADVTKASGEKTKQEQLLAAAKKELTPLQEAVTKELTAKQEAIKKVIAQDTTDTVAVKADYTAAAAEIADAATYNAKVGLYATALKDQSAFLGEVTQSSGIADNAATAAVDESLKQVALVKAAGGELKLVEKKLSDAKDAQSKLATALVDANNSLNHWKSEKGVAEGKTAGLKSTNDTDKSDYDGKAKTVSDLVADYNTKNGLYDAANVLYLASKAKYDAMYKIYTDVKSVVDASSSVPGADSGFSTQRDALITSAKSLRDKHAAFITEFKKNQGDASGDYHGFTTGKTCGTAQKGNSAVATKDTVAKCRTACTAAKYVTYLATYDAAKTNYDTEFEKQYNAGSNNGSDLKYVTDKTGCIAFTFNTGDSSCWFWDKDVATEGGDETNVTCYIKKSVQNAIAGGTGTNALWKAFYDFKVGDYKTKYDAYVAELGKSTGWAEYEKKAGPERKRVADVAVMNKEMVKSKAAADAYKSGTLDGLEGTMTSTKSTKNTAYGKITDLAYYQAVKARDDSKVKWDASKAIYDANLAKVARVNKIITHTQDTGNANAGSLKDITDKKAAQDGVVTQLEKDVEASKLKKTNLDKAVTDTKKAMDEAKAAWDLKKAAAAKALTDAKTPLETVTTLRDAVASANVKVKKAQADVTAKNSAIKIIQKAVDAAVADLNTATVKCTGLKYDQFQTDVATKKSERDTTLKAIEKLIDGRKAYAHGVTNGRCEKPSSNGDNLKRGKCSADTDCCGAATGRPNGVSGALVTIEVCLPKESKTYNYQPPRAPLAKEDPVKTPWPFVCIGGASKLAGAAVAVLASAYAMA